MLSGWERWERCYLDEKDEKDVIWMRKKLSLDEKVHRLDRSRHWGIGDGGNIRSIGNLCRKGTNKSREANPKTSVHCQPIESKQKWASHLENCHHHDYQKPCHHHCQTKIPHLSLPESAVSIVTQRQHKVSKSAAIEGIKFKQWHFRTLDCKYQNIGHLTN